MENLNRVGWTVTLEVSVGYYRFSAKHHNTGYTLTESVRGSEVNKGARKISDGMIAFDTFHRSQA